MTDKIAFSEQPAGQPGKPSQGGDAQGTPAAGLSSEQMLVIRALVEETAEAKFRQAQSLTDKAEARVMEKVAQAGNASGGAAPAKGQAGGEPPAAPAAEVKAGEAVQPPAKADAEAITQTAWGIMERMGVEITKDDPESELLDRSNPGAFYASVAAACQAKAKRLNSPPPAAINPMGAGAPARVDYTKANPLDLFSMGYKKK